MKRFSQQVEHRLNPAEHEAPGPDRPENKPLLEIIDATADTTVNGINCFTKRSAFWTGAILAGLACGIPVFWLVFIGYLIFMKYLQSQQAGPWKS